MTCGREECQQARHADRCRVWHQANATVSSHYEDVVVPFRREQPDYQRRWRWGQRLREIRERTGGLAGAVLSSLRALVGQGEALMQRAVGAAQTGVFRGERLVRAVETVRTLAAAIEQFQQGAAELAALGV